MSKDASEIARLSGQIGYHCSTSLMQSRIDRLVVRSDLFCSSIGVAKLKTQAIYRKDMKFK